MSSQNLASSSQLFLILESCFEKWPICLQLLYLVFSFSGGWRVVGSDQPVIAEPGDDVILPCHISSRVSAVDMEVRWFRDTFEKPVHLYRFRKNLLGTQDRAYQGRTALSPEALQTGDLSLHLRNLRPSDRGVYTCLADDGKSCFEKWLICLQLFYLVFSFSDAWRVVGSDQPVIAEPGDDVILPCHISPRLSAVDMEVRWFRDAFENPVHLYNFQENLLETQDRAYQDRTALSPPALERGDISLRLRNLRPSDRGIYTCYAHDGSQYEEGQTEVIVAGQ
ncbi:butyrophilin-like protein 2 [Acipenser oxyrinchus oxyrinchus]|uniref:Butyrophilin-like protein 2 n=1 Tax=Acipenser oxyrinchus oxyrinchus TaxID=40147 RepID=A0AAD8FVF3_ACIOX|nr:butyrophilin-like protein 2 [Acipenser oxyrinchus oxyrinchus]